VELVTPRKRYSFWINDRQADGLKQVKAAEDITESEQIRQALNDWLAKKGVSVTAPKGATEPKKKSAPRGATRKRR
jgi:hypothetical protein